MQPETPTLQQQGDPWVGPDGSICVRHDAGALQIKSWAFASGNNEASADLHLDGRPAELKARSVGCGYVWASIELPGDITTSLSVYLSAAQAVTLGLALTKAGTEVVAAQVLGGVDL